MNLEWAEVAATLLMLVAAVAVVWLATALDRRKKAKPMNTQDYRRPL